MTSSSSVHVLSTTRLHPAIPSSTQKRVPLSILDSNVVNFACTSGLWVYDKALPIPTITRALELTLARGYAPWCGQLQFAKYDAERAKTDHTLRYGRVVLEYGSAADPGVEFVVAHCDEPLTSESYFPTRDPNVRLWDAGRTSARGLIPTSPPLALYNLVDYDGLPGVIVQLTTFSCGGIVIGVKMAHCLGDAQTLVTFVTDWASAARSLLNGDEIMEQPTAIFDPIRIDSGAGGDIDAPGRDEAIVEKSRTLPINRNDWWAAPLSGNTPTWALGVATIPKEIQDAGHAVEHGTGMPWSEWDFGVAVKHYCMHFAADDVDRIWEACQEPGTTVRLSKFDTLQTFLWMLVLRGRQSHFIQNRDQTANLNITLGVRERLNPPLSPTFLGSPIFLARVEANLSSKPTLQTLASSIRNTVSLFSPTSDAVPSLLHDLAYEVCPYRIWGAFLGRRNCIVTSWLRLGAYEIDFGMGGARAVEAVMPSMDGCIQVMDASAARGGGRWYENGIVASLHLREDVMKNLLEDPLLAAVLRGEKPIIENP
ncbi:hypothetical protein BDZ89DRAFT_1070705 [Hymenopellis radicata]|nr:hypothetical protein BDZ89DRAFT_1070705 [Hymenopellis radicata]